MAARSRTPWVIAGAVATAYALAALLLHHRLRSTGYDLGIFSQSVDHWAHLSLPVSPLKNDAEGLPAGTGLLSDHVSPVMALLAVPWRVWPHPETLLVAQALLLASACVPVHRYAARRLGAGAATGVTLAFALCGSLQATAAFDVHEVAFAVPLVALAVERHDAGHPRVALAAALALLLVKEDLGLLVAAMGLLLAVAGGRRVAGLLLAAAGLAGSAVAIGVVMPAAGGRFRYWTYSALGPDAPSAAAHVLAHPLSTLHLAVTPGAKLVLLAWLFASLSVCALASPLVLLALPLLAELLLSDRSALWRTDTHYTAVLATVLTLAACDGLARLLRRVAPGRRPVLARRAAWVGVAVAVTQGLTLGSRSLLADVSPHSYVLDARAAAGRAALATVPGDAATVTATDRLLLHLLDHPDVRLLGPAPVPAGWLVVDEQAPDYPLPPAEVRRRVEGLVAAGWTTVFARDGFVVLRSG